MHRAAFLVFALTVSSISAEAGSGYDSDASPSDLVERLKIQAQPPAPRIGEWLRIRGFDRAPLWPYPGHVDPVMGSVGEAWAASLDGSDVELASRIRMPRQALAQLARAGYRSVGFLRWERVWPSGARSGEASGNRSPLDLREAYRRGYAFGRTYGDLVDAWEIENEPDAGFFADNADVFAAFYKAVALGLAAGRHAARGADTEAWTEGMTERTMPGRARGRSRSLIVMPPLVLPPGPYLEQLRANGFLAYTEGANLHYYGFADDYSGAVLRLRDALTSPACEGVASVDEGKPGNGFRPGKTGAMHSGFALAKPGHAFAARRLPVFVTEWGYPRLDGYAAQTVEGRVRQWRYYRDVALQNERLGVHAPMAFYLPPYYEYGAKEFGLTMPPAVKREAHFGFEVEAGPIGTEGRRTGEPDEAGWPEGLRTGEPDEAGGPEGRRVGGAEDRRNGASEGGTDEAGGSERWTEPVFRAGGLSFTPADFGAERLEKWMARIGEQIGGNEASPALAWLMDRAGRRDLPDFVRAGPRARGVGRFLRDQGDWLVRTEAPSPVVLDLIAGEDLLAVKSFCGYVVGRGQGGESRGAAKLVLYHFGREAADVRLSWPAGLRPAEGAATDLRLTLQAGERREIPVVLSVPDAAWVAHEIGLVAEVMSGGERTRSRWATRLYPHPAGMQAKAARPLAFPANEAVGNRGWLLGEQASEEAKVSGQGRWLVTPGVVVEETPTLWRFHVSALPPEPMRPARAELPLPDAWAPWERGLVMSFAYRSLPADGAQPLRADDPDPLRRLRTGKLGDTLEFFLRTRAGNVYCIQSPLRPGAEWAPYNQPSETLTPGFPGRHAAPLKIAEERPASLVFFLRPASLPAVYEIARPSLAHWRKPE